LRRAGDADAGVLVVVGPQHAVAPAHRAVARRRAVRLALERPTDAAAVARTLDHRRLPTGKPRRAILAKMAAPEQTGATTMVPSTFQAFVIEKAGDGVRGALAPFAADRLDAGEVAIRVHYSSINYKDALAATGAGRIIRRFPCIGGIDLAGEVV